MSVILSTYCFKIIISGVSGEAQDERSLCILPNSGDLFLLNYQVSFSSEYDIRSGPIRPMQVLNKVFLNARELQVSYSHLACKLVFACITGTCIINSH